MNTPKSAKQMSRNNIAQDQESDKQNAVKKTKVSSNTNPQSKSGGKANSNFEIEKSKGRLPAASRLGKHPLPKERVKAPPQRVRPTGSATAQPTVQKNLKTKQPVHTGKPPVIGKSLVGPSTVVHNRPMAKGRAFTREALQNRLKKKSPWYDSIMNPIKGGGVKIPDPIGTETGTYQHVQNVSVGANSNGIAGLRVICPYVNSFHTDDFPDGTPSEGSNYQVTNVTATVDNLAWGDFLIPTNPHIAFPFDTVPALMKANARTHRVVSACVVAQNEASAVGDAGETTMFVTPMGCNPRNVSYKVYQSQYDSIILPNNVHSPAVARWYPCQGTSYIYDDGTVDTSDAGILASYQDFRDPNS